ncbi:MAG: twin-arginine translocase TatA/TatE family subunit [Vicinamibacteria bacterium]
MIPRLGLPEILVILAIVILIFGANRLPQLGKGLGQSIRNFKNGLSSGEKEEKDASRRRFGGLACSRSRRPGREARFLDSTFDTTALLRGPRFRSDWRTTSRMSASPSSTCRRSMSTRVTWATTLSPSR